LRQISAGVGLSDDHALPFNFVGFVYAVEVFPTSFSGCPDISGFIASNFNPGIPKVAEEFCSGFNPEC
jgi:hypothetical protein